MNTTDKTCAKCFFGDSIDGRRYKCHVSRPTTCGFPKVDARDFCSYWTDPETMDRPFFYLLPNVARTFGTASAKETTNENEQQDNA